MPNKKALLVGINYPNTSHQLRGCINDVAMMNHTLTKYFGFTNEDNKVALLDDGATAKNIKEQLEWLVDGAQPGDVLFFHFSGHGTQIRDTSGEERDGLDEIICPIDLSPNNMVTDDDFSRIFSKLPEGVNLTTVLDCCHSGQGLRNFNLYDYSSTRTMRTPDSLSDEELFSLPINHRALSNVSLQAQKGILISGCKSHQTSADALIAGEYRGAATFFLNRVLFQHRMNITYRDLIEKTNKELNIAGYAQDPELVCSPELADKKFLESLVK